MRKDERTSSEKTKRRHAKRRHAKRRNDERTPSEKTKRRNNATRKDENTKSATRKDDKLTVLNVVFLHGVFLYWNFDFSCGGFRYFVFSRGVISSFRMALFRLFAWRLFVFWRGVISGRKDEMAQTSHHKVYPCKIMSLDF